MRRKCRAVASLLAGLVAIVAICRWIYTMRTDRQEVETQALEKSEERIRVLVARTDIRAGRRIARPDLAWDTFRKSSIGNKAVLPEEASTILRRKALVEIRKGYPILWEEIESEEDAKKRRQAESDEYDRRMKHRRDERIAR